MASKIQSDGKTVTITTDEGRWVDSNMAELNLTSTSDKIATSSGYRDDWSFTVDLHTRLGTLIRKGRPKVVFSCTGAI